MALWTMILRKMANNKWLQLNLWFGLTVCVALFSSMPLYSGAILQRTLYKELQQMQAARNIYPGQLRVTLNTSGVNNPAKLADTIANSDSYVLGFAGRVNLEMKSYYINRSTPSMKMYGADATDEEKKRDVTGNLRAVSDFDKRVRLVDGRLPDPARSDGVYEVLVTQSYLIKLKRDLNEEITGLNRTTGQTYRMLPVGIVDASPEGDPYLPFPLDDFKSSLYMPLETFESEFLLAGKAKVSGVRYVLALDYTQLSTGGIDTFVAQAEGMKRYLQSRFSYNAEMDIPALETIGTYLAKKERLDRTLLALYAPVMFMLAFYLYMTSNLIIERQKTEIAVLRSRGASRLQIMLAYAAEGLLLGLSALAAGPPLGVLFTKVLGASDGFMSFVDRSALEVVLDGGVYRIAAAAVFGAIVLTLIPAFRATRVSIVGHKQKMARLDKMSFWHKIGLDVILVGAAVYLLYGFNKRMDEMRALALEAGSLQVDPLLFLMPALFALGGGLLVLRVYPWFIRLLYWAGRKWWPPALYSTLVQISRSSGQYLTIKVFLIMTVAMGLYSAGAARTINGNMESKIRYGVGADVALTTHWMNDAPPPGPPAPAGGPAPAQESEPVIKKRVQYTEPPFLPMTELEGVESAARVFIKDDTSFSAAAGNGTATLYGINTYEFGQTAWMQPGLLGRHINEYLNLLSSDPKAVLISQSLADEYKLKPGDGIYVGWEGLDQALFTVYGIVDYWPGWNPNPKPEAQGPPGLIVGHLESIQNRLALEPYQVWLKLKDGASSSSLYESLAERNIPITELRDGTQELIRSKNDPFRLAINGVMTLGFVISMLISFLGFLVFWILSLSGRTLQFGVLRAMGIPFGQIIGMLISEQLLTSGAAVLIGVLTGNVVSRLFVPLFELSFNPAEQVPPFDIVFRLGDYVQLYGMVAVMLTVGLCVLGYRLSRVKISQALKLGEE